MPDPGSPSGELLLEHAGSLRRMARALTADRHLQDDLVQEAYLKTLERPPRERGAFPGWLRSVLLNRFRMERRGGGRRAVRERAAAREEAQPAAAWSAERRELLRLLTDTVTELEEPFRAALLHRFFDDLPPREIARLTGAPVETVRTRIKRGLQLVRESLDRRHGGERRLWLTPMVLFARLPLKGAGSGAVALSGGGGGLSLWFSTLGVMSVKKSVISFVLLLVGGALYFTLVGPGEAEPGQAGTSDPVALAGGSRPEPGRPFPAPRRQPAPPDPVPSGRIVPTPGELLVRVLDGQGRPQPGVPTRLFCGRPGEEPAPTPLTAVTTGPEGIAAYRNLRQTLVEKADDPERIDQAHWRVVVDVPLVERVGRSFVPGSLPGGVVDLVLPPTGSLVVRVVDGKGKLSRRELEVGLAVARHDPDGGGLRSSAVAFTRRVRGGAARFAQVGLGLELDACLVRRRPGQEQEWEDLAVIAGSRVRAAGPIRAGEEQGVTLVVPPLGGVLRGRLVGPAGRPVANRIVQVGLDRRIRVGDKPVTMKDRNYARLETTGNGGFRLELRREESESLSRKLIFTCPAGPEGGGELRGAVPLELPDGGGELDLGDIFLATPGTLAAGIMVDRGGQPLAGIRFEILDQLFHLRDASGRVHYRPRLLARGRTDEGGRFRAVGKASHPELLLRVYSEDYAPAEGVRLPRGGSGLRIVLHRLGGLQGRLLLPEGARSADLSLRLRPREGSGGACFFPPSRDGRFTRRGLFPGTWDLEVVAGRECLFRLAGVEVTGGKIAAPPALQEVDLRNRFHCHRIRVMGPDGELLERAEVRWGKGFTRNRTACVNRIEREGGRTRVRTMALATITSLAERVDILVRARGYRSRILTGVRGDIRVRLQPALRVGLLLDRPPRLHDPGHSIGLDLERLEGPPGREEGPALRRWTGRLVRVTFDGKGRAACEFGAPGKYRLRWFLLHRIDRWHHRRHPLQVKDRPCLEVREGSGEQELRVPVPLEELARLSRAIAAGGGGKE